MSIIKLQLAKHSKLLVCVSGGADSVCLLRRLVEAGYHCVVAHCNFHLRGEESDEDERFVRELCCQLGVEIVTTSFDTLLYARERHLSTEMAARELRYAWFEEQRQALGCDYIAVAHNLNDAVETFFLNLTRGTGLKGLTGMKMCNGYIVRPLLDVSREEIEGYLKEIGQSYRTDRTNADVAYRRNRIRHNILPEFIEMNPSFLKTMQTTMENLRAAEALMEGEAEGRLQELYLMLQPYGFNHDVICQIYKAEMSKVSGKRFVNDRATVVVDRGEARVYPVETERAPSVPDKSIIISGKTEHAPSLPNKCIRISEETEMISGKTEHAPSLRATDTYAFFDADKIKEPLALRTVKNGDYFIPYGMRGRKKLSDFLTSLKLDIIQKQRQLLLVDADDNILWVVGRRTDNRFAVTNQTVHVAKITIEEK